MKLPLLKIIIYTSVLLTIIVVVVASCKKDTYSEVLPSEIDKRFDRLWGDYLESSKGGWQNNDKGRLSWDDGYALDGLLAFYRKTKNTKYLDTFVNVANKIMSLDDFTLGKRDKYRGDNALVGWGSPRYTHDNSHHIFGVTDAMILSPIVNFCNIIKNEDAFFNKKYTNISVFFLNKALLEFEQIQKNDWINIDSSRGYFQDPYHRSVMINTPLNQFSRVGVLTIELYKATGDEKFLVYAKNMASYLKSLLIYEDDYFYWKYWVRTNSTQVDLTDDLSHAMLVVQFIVTCYENNIIFTKGDIESLVNLFIKKITSSDKSSFNLFIDGKGGLATDINISYYFLLSPHSKNVYDILSNWYKRQRITLDTNSLFNHFGERVILTEGFLMLYQN